MPDFKQRWIPCSFCYQRVKLFCIDDDFHHVVWLHQLSDEEAPYQPCRIEDMQAVQKDIDANAVAYPFLTG